MAVKGVDAIVRAANPAGHRKWAELVLPMVENTIAAAQASGARVLLPETIYNFGADAFSELRSTQIKVYLLRGNTGLHHIRDPPFSR
jgi:hypothetical protein